MKRIIFCGLLMFIASPLPANEKALTFGPFGKIALYYETPQPAHVVLFVSGDGGWNLGVVGMARELASLNALVVGIDINHFVKEIEASNEKCLYPAADFQFHLTDWFTSQKRPNSQMVHPEMGKLRGKRILCFYGTEDDDALCRQLDPGLAKVISIQGGHRFGKAYQPIIDAILQEIQ